MTELDALRLVIAIVDTGSLAAAARRLGQAASAATRGLASLEARLGVRLFERTTRRVQPTEAGRRLAEQARRILGDLADAMAEATGEASAPRGLLRIGAPLVFGRRHVAPLVGAFLDAEPDVTAELVLADRNVDLLEEGLDVAVRIGPLGESAMIARRVGAVRRVLVASPDYLSRRGAPETPADLAGHDTVLFTAPGAAAEWRFAGGTVRIHPRFAVNAAEPAIEAACAGRGVVLALSYQVADEVADGRLVRLLRAHEPPSSPVHLVFPTARLMAPRLRVFLDFTAPRLAALAVLRD